MKVPSLALGLLVLSAAAWAAEESAQSAVFQGTWVNRKMRTQGPLRCTMEISDESEWSARFDGKFKSDNFKYDVKFDAKKTGAKTDLKGKADVDGDEYEWIGVLKGDSLTIRYKSVKGYNGEFNMKKQAPPKTPPKKKK